MKEHAITREELFLTSKVPPMAACSSAAIQEACETTLRDLQTTYLDALLVHWPFCTAPNAPTWPPPMEYRRGYSAAQLRETWRAMEHLYRAGKVRSIGLSNIGVNRLATLLASSDLEQPPAIVQTELHPYLQMAQLRSFCRSHGIAVTAYCSLGSAARPSKYQSTTDPLLLTEPVLRSVAREANASPATVALAWALAHGLAVIPKSARPERIVSNYAATSLTLEPAQIRAIDSLERSHRFLAVGWTAFAWKPSQTLQEIIDDDAPPSLLPSSSSAPPPLLLMLAAVLLCLALLHRHSARLSALKRGQLCPL